MSQSLGRGLGSLIPKKTINTNLETGASVIQEEGRVLKISPDIIEVNPQQPRQHFKEEALDDLAASIKEHGIIQPLIVTKKDNYYELIAGERRLRSAKKIGLKTVPVIVREEEEQEKLELALIENIQRENLNPLETAVAYQRLIDEFNITQEEVARRVGKARSSVANSLRLLSLPEAVQEALVSGKISEAHAKYLLGLGNKEKQNNIFKKILRYNLTVAETNREIKKIGGTKKAKQKDYEDISLEDRLSSNLGTKVEIKRKGKGGKIIIDFYSAEDLRGIINKIDDEG